MNICGDISLGQKQKRNLVLFKQDQLLTELCLLFCLYKLFKRIIFTISTKEDFTFNNIVKSRIKAHQNIGPLWF